MAIDDTGCFQGLRIEPFYDGILTEVARFQVLDSNDMLQFIGTWDECYSYIHKV